MDRQKVIEGLNRMLPTDKHIPWRKQTIEQALSLLQDDGWVSIDDFKPREVEKSFVCWIELNEGEILPAKYDVGGLFLQFNSRVFYNDQDIKRLMRIPPPKETT